MVKKLFTFRQNAADLIRPSTTCFTFFARGRTFKAIVTTLEIENTAVAIPVSWNLIVLLLVVLGETVLNRGPELILQDKHALYKRNNVIMP